MSSLLRFLSLTKVSFGVPASSLRGIHITQRPTICTRIATGSSNGQLGPSHLCLRHSSGKQGLSVDAQSAAKYTQKRRAKSSPPKLSGAPKDSITESTKQAKPEPHQKEVKRNVKKAKKTSQSASSRVDPGVQQVAATSTARKQAKEVLDSHRKLKKTAMKNKVVTSSSETSRSDPPMGKKSAGLTGQIHESGKVEYLSSSLHSEVPKLDSSNTNKSTRVAKHERSRTFENEPVEDMTRVMSTTNKEHQKEKQMDLNAVTSLLDSIDLSKLKKAKGDPKKITGKQVLPKSHVQHDALSIKLDREEQRLLSTHQVQGQHASLDSWPATKNGEEIVTGTEKMDQEDGDIVKQLDALLANKDMPPDLHQYLRYLRRVVTFHMKEEMKAKKRKPGLETNLLEIGVVPFWNPTKLKTMEEVKIASQLVRLVNKKFSDGHARERYLEKEQLRKQTNFNVEALAYVNTCIQSDMLRKAHTFLFAQNKSRNRNKVSDVVVFNAVVRAWAKQGNLHMIKELFVQMEDVGVKPNLASYVYALDCLGRQEVFPHDIASRMLADIRKAGFDLRNIVNECAMTHEEWSNVQKTVRYFLPDFDLKPPAIAGNYACTLLQPLNEELAGLEEVPNPHAGVVPTDELRRKVKEQVAVEKSPVACIPSILPQNDITREMEQAREKLKEEKEKWHKTLVRAFKRDLAVLEANIKHSARMSIYPYLKALPQDIFIDCMHEEIEKLALHTKSHSVSLAYLHSTLGWRIHQQYLVKQRQDPAYIDRMLEVYSDFLAAYNSNTLNGSNHRQIWHDLLLKHFDGSSLEMFHEQWPPHIAKEIGKFLYNIILLDVKIDSHFHRIGTEKSEIPAFYTMYQLAPSGLAEEEVVKPHPDIVRLYEQVNMEHLTFASTDMPLLTPPPPWTSLKSGGSLLAGYDLIRQSHSGHYQRQMLETVPAEETVATLDALNAISLVPWKINKPVLDLAIEVFNSGGNDTIDIPRPASSWPDPPRYEPYMSIERRSELTQERMRVKKEKQEAHSLWMTELYRLSVANKFRDETFWFPHNLDFRGRSYAVPPHFNHLGGDLTRSLLLFGKGKPLGQHGLDWLKIHLVNLTGLKKRSSNAERLQFADTVMAEIRDSADNPLTGNKWWQSSDEPWQTLACCKEIINATRSLDPASYITHFPVHQDGSCNGLQHYAALGRDQAGAESVNLHPFPLPQDVYSDVVELVERERMRDAHYGVNIAVILENFVKRKVIKQTIMTTVYGVTPYGARLQIEGQLEDIDDFPKEHVFDASRYLTVKTFKCLEQMFLSTKQIQDWLTVSAELISSISNEPVSWVTPLGFPVIQPYFHTNRELKNPFAKTNRVYFNFEKPNMRRQRNGFPPNFIHSLDSTHMMLTALYCLRNGITFVSVHDCYWTHPCDVEIMNKVCREQFVALHNQPILEELAEYMYEKFGFHEESDEIGCKWVHPITRNFVNHLLQRVPERGTFQLEKVLDSTYFFS